MAYTTNKKAPPSDATVAALIGQDNRTAVATPDPTTPANVIVGSALAGKNGDTIGIGATAGTVAPSANAFVAGPPAVAAYDSVVIASGKVVKINTEGPLSRANLRTTYFYANPGQKGGGIGGMNALGAPKLCYVNVNGRPLDANGAPTTVALAINAATTSLTAQGQAVTNWASVHKTGVGRSAPPGIYGVDVRQTALYAPYLGWTAQNTPRANAT